MRYKVVQYSTDDNTEITVGTDDILLGIDSRNDLIIVLRFIRTRDA